MKQLTYKREWLARERMRQHLENGTLVSWWRTMNGETVLVIRRAK